jgi:predicted DCC family thiol-disulfide oxidoreductase YuxK
MEKPIILFDGICNLCNGLVRFIIKYDKKLRFEFSSLQSDYAKKLLNEFDNRLGYPDSIVLIENKKIYLRSDAVLRIARQLGGIWKLTGIFYIIPRFLRDAIYNVVAKNRYRIFGKRDSCMVPGPEIKSRFK